MLSEVQDVVMTMVAGQTLVKNWPVIKYCRFTKLIDDVNILHLTICLNAVQNGWHKVVHLLMSYNAFNTF